MLKAPDSGHLQRYKFVILIKKDRFSGKMLFAKSTSHQQGSIFPYMLHSLILIGIINNIVFNNKYREPSLTAIAFFNFPTSDLLLDKIEAILIRAS
jgi:hypothetical protein